MLFEVPALSTLDAAVLADIDQLREELRFSLATPRRWTGLLRRNLLAKAVQGSNSIEGYVVNTTDAVAAIDAEGPLEADVQTWQEITGYRTAINYVLQLADDPDFRLDTSLLRSLHFMMLQHDLLKWPGRYRQGPIFVEDEQRGVQVYEGVEWSLVGPLMEDLVAFLESCDAPSYVRAAMAHLNLVMVHPFRDGNGRMARIVQTLVLARERIVTPEFYSIEEFLGRNTADYYSVLAAVGGGAWHPERDATAWVRFCLRAHHIQAQTVKARLEETGRLYVEIDELVAGLGLPERCVEALFDGAQGLIIRRGPYARRVGVEDRTATRDLQAMVDAHLLLPHGERRGRTYAATRALSELRHAVRADRPPVVDPYLAKGGVAELPFG